MLVKNLSCFSAGKSFRFRCFFILICICFFSLEFAYQSLALNVENGIRKEKRKNNKLKLIARKHICKNERNSSSKSEIT